MKGFDMPNLYPSNIQKVILNWGKELEKHDKLLKQFSVLEPLSYDIDTTFHKLFG
jgi:hypothetical protein